MFYVILTISYLRAETIETSSLPTDSSRPLFKEIEIFSILTVWLYISSVSTFLNIRASYWSASSGFRLLCEIPVGAITIYLRPVWNVALKCNVGLWQSNSTPSFEVKLIAEELSLIQSRTIDLVNSVPIISCRRVLSFLFYDSSTWMKSNFLKRNFLITKAVIQCMYFFTIRILCSRNL